MKRPVQVTLLVLSGLGLLHTSLLTDLCLRYVRPGMRPLLIASGVLLLALGVAEAWPRRTAGEPTDGRAHGHDHSAVPRVAWLLFLPALSLLFWAPPALGAYTAARQPPKRVSEQDHFDALPATSPLPLTLTDFTRRVRQDRTRAVEGRTVEMTGLVTPVATGEWDLTRIIISCCAADAQSVKVRVHASTAPPADTWVTVTGTWHPEGTLGTSSAAVALDARTVKKVPRPVNGYQDALPLPSAR
ncbi:MULTISPECIES: TIGR03943 family putative permease subunit [unclassified Streptomyces]|uniref:TIGR03943 family putative permease subunit n=1 Tax=unclassified Streptomyces TaxID=2593676 RepID=UPI0004BE54E2|nr:MULTISPECIES: TIGR03943 family protein [unclassified Streptomyces]